MFYFSMLSYRTNVKKYSDLMKSETMTPVERAVFWTEYAMKHGGTNHYQSSSRSTNVSWFQYYSLDTIGTLGLFLFFAICLVMKILFLLWGFMVGDRAIRSKSN